MLTNAKVKANVAHKTVLKIMENTRDCVDTEGQQDA